MASASPIIAGAFKGSSLSQIATKGEKMTIPIVDSAERANETETAAMGELAMIAIIPIPSALSADGRLCPKIENRLIVLMAVALMADMGIPENTR